MKRIILIFIICITYLTIFGNSKGNTLVSLKKNLSLNEGENYFIANMADIDIDKEGNIYIIDSKLIAILKFNKYGKFIKQCGRRGEGPGEFPGMPFIIEYGNNKLYITLFGGGASSLYVFDTNLSFIKKIKYNYQIPSFHVNKNSIYIPNIYQKTNFPFNIIKENGKFISNHKVGSLMSPLLYKNFKKIITDKKGNFYSISQFEDKIEKWDSKCIKVWSKYLFSGQGIQYMKDKDGVLIPNLNKGIWYVDIAVDNTGRVYILGGDNSKHNRRDVYVISKKGTLLTTITLPHWTFFIKIDNENNLYTRGLDGVLVRYKLESPH